MESKKVWYRFLERLAVGVSLELESLSYLSASREERLLP